ncbi:hypothetical protein, partial [Treponema sp. R8-4-B8]
LLCIEGCVGSFVGYLVLLCVGGFFVCYGFCGFSPFLLCFCRGCGGGLNMALSPKRFCIRVVSNGFCVGNWVFIAAFCFIESILRFLGEFVKWDLGGNALFKVRIARQSSVSRIASFFSAFKMV